MKHVIVLLLLIFSQAIVAASDMDAIEAQKANDGIIDEAALKNTKAAIALSSDFVEVAVAYNGNFTMATRVGDPLNAMDDNKHILYRHPFPGSSATTLRIDGQDFWNYQSQLLGEVVSAPETVNGINHGTWRSGDVQFTQNLFLVTGETGRMDTLAIEYEIRNLGSAAHEVGVRLLLDTELGGNDGAPFQIPGLGAVVNETELLGDAIPPVYLGFDRLLNPDLAIQGTLISGRATVPDRVLWGSWGHLNDKPFDSIVNPNVTLLTDSAVATYWNPVILEPSKTRIIQTWLGQGAIKVEQKDLIVGLYGPTELVIRNAVVTPNPFNIIAYITNPESPEKTSTSGPVKAELSLPPQLELTPGQSLIQTFPPIEEGGTAQANWRVAYKGGDATHLEYGVVVQASNSEPISVSRAIELNPTMASVHNGFQNGVPIGEGLAQSSIAMADLDGDGAEEIVVGGADGTLYGYNGNGLPANKKPVGPAGSLLTLLSQQPILSSPTPVDVDLDGRVDILFGADSGGIYHVEYKQVYQVLEGKSVDAQDEAAPTEPRPQPAAGEEDDSGR